MDKGAKIYKWLNDLHFISLNTDTLAWRITATQVLNLGFGPINGHARGWTSVSITDAARRYKLWMLKLAYRGRYPVSGLTPLLLTADIYKATIYHPLIAPWRCLGVIQQQWPLEIHFGNPQGSKVITETFWANTHHSHYVTLTLEQLWINNYGSETIYPTKPQLTCRGTTALMLSLISACYIR